MKGRILYILMLLLALSSCGGGNDTTPRYVHDWSVTFDPKSDEPFGTMLLMDFLNEGYLSEDDYLSEEEEKKGEEEEKKDTIEVYTSCDKRIFRETDKNLLYVTNGEVPLEEIQGYINYRLHNGYSTIIAANGFGPLLDSYAKPFDVSRFAESKTNKEPDENLEMTIFRYHSSVYKLPKEMCSSSFKKNSLKGLFPALEQYSETLINEESSDRVKAVRYATKDGTTLMLVSVPLLFSNYGVMSYENASLIVYLLNKGMDECPKWAVCFNGEKSSEANVYTSHRKNTFHHPYPEESKSFVPDWLISLMVIGGFIAFLLFCAKRRQRIIPYMPEAQNQTVNYAKQVSLNYFWKNECQAILRKKYVIFKDLLQDKTHINLNDLEHWDDSIDTLAKITGMERNNLPGFFHRLQRIQNEDVSVDIVEMKSKIGKMNLIISKLK